MNKYYIFRLIIVGILIILFFSYNSILSIYTIINIKSKTEKTIDFKLIKRIASSSTHKQIEYNGNYYRIIKILKCGNIDYMFCKREIMSDLVYKYNMAETKKGILCSNIYSNFDTFYFSNVFFHVSSLITENKSFYGIYNERIHNTNEEEVNTPPPQKG